MSTKTKTIPLPPDQVRRLISYIYRGFEYDIAFPEPGDLLDDVLASLERLEPDQGITITLSGEDGLNES